MSQETDVISIMTSVFKKFTPRKLAYPLQNSGWKITFLSTWPHFSAHVSFWGCSRVFCVGRDFFRKFGFLFVLTRVGATQILTKKHVQKMKKTVFYPFVSFDCKLRPKSGVNSGIRKNRKKHYKLDFFWKKVGFCSGSFH